jgi:hypothetical protein
MIPKVYRDTTSTFYIEDGFKEYSFLCSINNTEQTLLLKREEDNSYSLEGFPITKFVIRNSTQKDKVCISPIREEMSFLGFNIIYGTYLIGEIN